MPTVGAPNDLSDFYMQRQCMTAMKNLRINPEIHIWKPDKGSGVVILNQVDYVNKMLVILRISPSFDSWEAWIHMTVRHPWRMKLVRS